MNRMGAEKEEEDVGTDYIWVVKKERHRFVGRLQRFRENASSGDTEGSIMDMLALSFEDPGGHPGGGIHRTLPLYPAIRIQKKRKQSPPRLAVLRKAGHVEQS